MKKNHYPHSHLRGAACGVDDCRAVMVGIINLFVCEVLPMSHPTNQLTRDNQIDKLMHQQEECVDRGDFKDAHKATLLLVSHLLWRIERLEE